MNKSLEIIQQKRKEAAERRQRELEKQESVKVAQDTTGNVAAEIARQSARSRQSTQPVKIVHGSATSEDIDKLVGAVQDIIIAQRAEGSRLSDNLDDTFDDLIEAINEITIPSTPIQMKDGKVLALPDNSGIGKKLDRVVRAINDIRLPDNSPILEKLTALGTAIKSVKPVDRTDEVIEQLDKLKPIDRTNEIITALGDLKTAIEGVEVSPVVNVPETKQQKIDLEPVVDAVKSLKVDIDLDNFMAQDLDAQEAFEYVGLVRPDGAWYIIENDVEGKTLRYKFGKEKYASAWKKHGSLSYKLINEAYNEISA